MEVHLRQKAEMLKSKVGALTLEPHVVVIASDAEELWLQPTYAVIGPQLYYRVDSIPQAVDLIIKACFLFDVNFPAAARSSWIFIQRAIFGIVATDDIVSSRTQELLSSVHC